MVSFIAQIPFINPGLVLWAFAAGLIPIVIHWINRRRYRRTSWAAMSFLLAANRRSARRLRIEQWLLLATRISLVVLAGLAVARPFLPRGAVTPWQAPRVHRIILLDNSLSMQAARPDGRTRFEAAKAATQRLLASFPPGDGISLITLAEPAEAIIAHAAYDHRLVKDAAGSVPATLRNSDFAGGTDVLKRVIRESDAAPGNHAVYIVSDFTANLWRADAPGNVPPGVRKAAEMADQLRNPETNLILMGVDPGTVENLGVTQLALDASLVSVHVPAAFAISVTNFGEKTARGGALQLRRDGQTVRREALPEIGPGQTYSTTISTEFSSRGSRLLEARISTAGEDALLVDNVRYLSVEVRESTPVLIVDGRPGTRLIDGEAGYLATALAPQEEPPGSRVGIWTRPTASLFDATVVSELELSAELLSRYDVVALCNVSRLPREFWAQVEQFVAGGGGLFISLGDLVNVDHYNERARTGARPLLPGLLSRTDEAGEVGAAPVGFKLTEPPHLLLADFADHLASGLFRARVRRYVPVTPDAASEVVLRYANDDPALLFARFGEGRVALWTTTVSMEWNNLPGKGDFVAVMVGAMSKLASGRGEHRNLAVGQLLEERLAPAEASLPLRIKYGEGSPVEPTIVPVPGGLAARFGPLERVQPLELEIGEDVRGFAVNSDPVESAIRTASASEIDAALERPFVWMTEHQVTPSITGRSVEWSMSFLAVVLALLLLELWLANRFAAAPAADRRTRIQFSPGRFLAGVRAP